MATWEQCNGNKLPCPVLTFIIFNRKWPVFWVVLCYKMVSRNGSWDVMDLLACSDLCPEDNCSISFFFLFDMYK